jgi:dTDP-4-dehydrorhamnose reductase
VSSSDIEIWASPEPTIARLDATTYRDQCEETGHARRESDIERLAALGVSASRYPVLWEHVERNGPGARDYSWAQRRLALVTLLHHGSGPPHTELLDDAFPELFAAYAAETARRFPWVKRWTPINEPLTTARFSTLYGVWYPSARDHRAFGRAMLNQARAILLGFARIAAIVPAAQLMLTEDLQGYVAGDLAAQAYVAHKRERAYLSLDLLCGNVRPGHALYAYLVRDCGLAPRELDRLRRLARPPDLMGWNYYPNSERYVSSSPEGPYFANVAFVFRADHVHFGERHRWLLQRYDDVVALRGEGVDLRALGAWAAFGMVDWNSLLRERAGSKEDGIYTCASGDAEPAWTLAADALRSLAAGRRASLASRPGWWEQRRSA